MHACGIKVQNFVSKIQHNKFKLLQWVKDSRSRKNANENLLSVEYSLIAKFYANQLSIDIFKEFMHVFSTVKMYRLYV